MEINTLEVFGFIGCLESLRLPFKKEVRSNIDILYEDNVIIYRYNGDVSISKSGQDIQINKKDLILLQTLIKRGDEHAKALRLIRVDCIINAPLFWWSEMDTYEVGIVNGCSESTMHTLKREQLSINDFEYSVSQDIINYIQDKIDNNITIEDIKNLLPSGYLQKRVISFSYQTLQRIYKQRLNHKLPQWKIFIDWIETLPMSTLITGKND
jgi:hypothetical protein